MKKDPIEKRKGQGKKRRLNKTQKQELIDLYESSKSRKEIQEYLAEKWDCTTRCVRNYAKDLNLNSSWQYTPNDKILVYDIETSRLTANLWWTGKQYVNYKSVTSEPKIISISWKWVGEDKVYSATWDNNHCDKKMVEQFLEYYNNASFVVGQNNNSFDNKWVKTRAAKHRLFVDRFVKSLDIYRLAKTHFRLISYSMDYMAHYFGLTPKQQHEGMIMWEMVENGTKSQQKEYLKKMVEYNKGDIITTEELYITLRPYFRTMSNKAVEQGQPKWVCPITGSRNVKHQRTLTTEMGVIQRILYCEDSDHQFKVSNKTYQDFLERG